MDFITIGHACHDTAPSGFVPGGAVTYSGLFANTLGLKTGILTSVGDDYLFKNLFQNILFHSIPASQTTIFENKYIGGHREQHLLARATDIHGAHLPDAWKKTKMVFIGPIANEVNFDFLDAFEQATICINPQGWMRRWDEKGKVYSKFFKHYSVLAKADITIISEEDVDMDYGVIKEMATAITLLVVTKGDLGCIVYFKNEKFEFPAYKTTVVDLTGAGDTFSTAFLVYYHETKDIFKAAQYANVAASFCVEAKGIKSLPSRIMIEQRYQQYINV